VKDEYDYRFICEDRDKLFISLKAVFFTKMNKNLPIYDLPNDLDKWATSKKDAKANVEKLPPDEYRNFDEDVYEPWTPGQQKRVDSVASMNSTDDEDLSKYETAPHFSKDGSTSSLSDF